MRRAIDRREAFSVHLSVNLRGAKTGVAQKLLNRAQVTTRAKQMGGEGMAQSVRRGTVRQAQQGPQALHRELHGARPQRPTARVPQMPQIPCTAIAPTGSSTRIRSIQAIP